MLAAICAFAASSLWYSPALLGRQFLALGGVAASVAPKGLNIAGEVLRNLLMASVVCWLLARLEVNAPLGFAAMLWLGFPVTLLSGSVLWQNVPPELALIHSGDWLMKILLVTLIPWLVNRNAETHLPLVPARASQPN